MARFLCPALALFSVFPGLLLAYLPVKAYLRMPSRRLAAWMAPLLVILCLGGGWACASLQFSPAAAAALVALVAAALYIRSLRISLWKSGTIALSVCALFCCLGSLVRAGDALLAVHGPGTESGIWRCLGACACFHALCALALAVSWRPAVRMVRPMVENQHFPQTWYAFWILPVVFIALSLFMIPRRPETLYTGRVAEGYFVVSLVLLMLQIGFYAIFLVTANSLNRNARLQQENQLLSLQQQRYESLRTAIEEARQTRHDLRHHFNQLLALAEEGDLGKIKDYLEKAVGRIPSLEMKLCENRAADSVIGYYCALARREGIPFRVQADLPAQLPADEIDLCLVLANLLENALEASRRTSAARRQIRLTAYLHGGSLLLIQAENAFDGEIREKDGLFQSSKRRGSGIGIQSVRRIAEKNGGASTFAYRDGVFTAKVMLRCR